MIVSKKTLEAYHKALKEWAINKKYFVITKKTNKKK